jgi:hypothetical protein
MVGTDLSTICLLTEEEATQLKADALNTRLLPHNQRPVPSDLTHHSARTAGVRVIHLFKVCLPPRFNVSRLGIGYNGSVHDAVKDEGLDGHLFILRLNTCLESVRKVDVGLPILDLPGPDKN